MGPFNATAVFDQTLQGHSLHQSSKNTLGTTSSECEVPDMATELFGVHEWVANQPSRFPPLPCRFSNMQHVADTHHRLMIGFDIFNKLQFNLAENQKTLAGGGSACRMSFLEVSNVARYEKISGDKKKGRQKSEKEVGLAVRLEKMSTENIENEGL